MKMPTISLIIPVYNVRAYLRKCLDSVAKQDYPALEVILVNDGSTDDSLAILEEYTAKYPHFHCYTIQNSGLGGARNHGLTKATGEYILFLDSDDYIAENCVNIMMTAATKTNSDMVICNCCDVSERCDILLEYKNQYRNATTSLAEEPELLFNRVSAWGKLFKRTLLDGFTFVSREWYEDMRLIPKLYLHAKTITYVDDTLFFYVQRKGSIMNSAKLPRNLEVIDAFQDLFGYYQIQGAFSQYQDALKFMLIEHVAIAGIARVAMGKGKEKAALLASMQSYLAGFDRLYDNPYLPTLTRNRKIILWCNRHKWYWLTKLLLTAKRAGHS